MDAGGWCRNAFATDGRVPVPPQAASARCWCFLAAIARAARDLFGAGYAPALNAAVRFAEAAPAVRRGPADLISWNDADGRTAAEAVKAARDAAAAALREAGGDR